MEAKLIDTLVAMDPRVPRTPSDLSSHGMPMDIVKEARARFLAKYSNPAFGWDIALAFADAGQPWPIPLLPKDKWLMRAFLMRRDSVRWKCLHVVDAWAIAHLDESRDTRGKLCSLLLAGCGQPPDRHRKDVSKALGIPLPVVEAFEALFYNVLDRHADHVYISAQVYPQGRLVEQAEDYSKNADISDLLKRAGYHHRDLELSTFLAGIGDATFLAKLSARSDREQELTRHLMGNALLLVHAGAINQRSVGMSRAQNILAATRQSGQVIEPPAIADAGECMADALRLALAAQDSQRVEIAKMEAGG